MSKLRLNDLVVQNLTADRQKLFIDASTPNFGVRVTARGTKSFVVIMPDRSYQTIGRYPAISLKEARQEAKRLLLHPEPKKRPQAITEALIAFLADCEARLRPSTREFYRHMLSGYREWPTNESNPHKARALKVFANWCVEHGYRPNNPYIRLKSPIASRDRVLTDDELRSIWQHDRPPFSDIVKLLILTGQRRGQLAAFDPAWVRDGCIHFPASVMKSKRAHTIPLTDTVQALIQRLEPFHGWSKSKARLDAESGVVDWVLHDLRRTFSTTMARLGVPLHVTEQLLDHRSTVSGVAAVYNRWQFLPEMREALLKYEKHLTTIGCT